MANNYVGNNVKLGENVRMWHFSYVGDNTEVGHNTKIGSLVHIDYNVKIGENCKIGGMVYIPPLTVIKNNVFVGPGVIFTNDPYPPCPKMVGVVIEDDVVICAGVILKAGIRIGKGAVIGMGAVVTKDVPPEHVVFGNPARLQSSRFKYDNKQEKWLNEHTPNI